MIAKDKYDPEFHVTAAELREAGIPVPGDIPGPAWTLRSSVGPGVTVSDPSKAAPHETIPAILRFELTASWGRMDATIMIPKKAKPCPNCSGSGDAPTKGPSLAGTTPDDLERIAFGAEPVADLVESLCPTCDGLGFLPA